METKENLEYVFPMFIRKPERINFDVELKPVEPLKQPTLTDEEFVDKILEKKKQ